VCYKRLLGHKIEYIAALINKGGVLKWVEKMEVTGTIEGGETKEILERYSAAGFGDTRGWMRR